MRSRIAIDIEAPPDVVFGLARHVDRWERLLPHYARSRVVSARPDGSLLVAFVAVRRVIPLVGLGIPVAWRARTWNEPDGLRLRFVHVAGPTKGMDVTWHIEPTPAGCRVTIEHDFRPRLPGFAVLVDRWFTRPIAGRTLATFKDLAESIADSVAGPSGPFHDAPSLSATRESDPVPVTNQPA
jgi:ribosome-associated toxin RatA of RatAB toxin-antitoxin module